MISPPSASTAGSMARSEPPVVRMSSTSRTRSPGAIVKPRRNSRRGVPSSARTSSAKIARTPSWRPVSKARTTPPVVGPATRSTIGVPSASRWRAAQNPHSSLVAAGSCRTRNFSRYRSEWRPLLSRKWPSRRAPERRNNSSVRAAMAAWAASSRAERMVVTPEILRGRAGQEQARPPGTRALASLAPTIGASARTRQRPRYGRYSTPLAEGATARRGRAVPTRDP